MVAPDAHEIDALASVAADLDRVVLMSYLGEPSLDAERALVDRLVAAGAERGRIGLGIGPRTAAPAANARRSAALRREVGGIALWGVRQAAAGL